MNKRNSSLLSSALRILLLFSTIVGTAVRGQTVSPSITTVPDNKTVTLGANLTLSVITTGSSPLGYQWQFEQNDLVFTTNNVCTLTNLQFAQAGDYRVILTNDAGSVTGLVTRLAVAPAFLKVAAGAFGSGGTGGAWGDFNNDGHIDLFVATGNGSSSLLYTNDGNGNLFRDTA